jgi:hypothetical protein
MNMQRRQSLEERKRDTREKIQLGGLVVKAGLRSADRAVILGALIDAAKRIGNQSEWARLRMIGKDSFADDSKEDGASRDADHPDDGNALEPRRD